jgi:hypothetical protein
MIVLVERKRVSRGGEEMERGYGEDKRRGGD